MTLESWTLASVVDVFLDKLGLLVGLGMELVAIVLLVAFLGPAGISILVALLVRLVVPQIFAVVRFYPLVLLTGVALPGSFHKRGIDNLPFVEGEALAVKITAELVEQCIKRACLAQGVLHIPNGLFVRDLIYSMYAKELAKTGAVDDLILNLFIAQTIITLQEYDFEHQYHIELRTACRRLAVFLYKDVLQLRTEHLKVHKDSKLL